MSWWGERSMKRKMQPSKGFKKAQPSLPAMYGKTAKKPEPDDKPAMPRGGKAALRRRLDGRTI